jgi:hypothetical protein
MSYVDYFEPRNLDRISFIAAKYKNIIDIEPFFKRRDLIDNLYKSHYKEKGYYCNKDYRKHYD